MANLKGLLGKGKGLAKNAGAQVVPIVAIGGGVIAAQKFMDFKTLFPNVNPDKWFIKHEGVVKIGAVIVTLAMWQKCPVWLKYVLWGVAVQGVIKATRQYTMGDAGKAFFEQIGRGDYDDAINKAAEDIKSLSNEFETGVSGEDDELMSGVNKKVQRNPAVTLQMYSNTGVSGMGLVDSEYEMSLVS